MSAAAIIEQLCAVARQVDHSRRGSRWYLFGSVLTAWERAADIDVAIVCADDEGCKVARAALLELALSAPLHLTLLTEQEDEELDFVSGVSGKLIFPRAVTRD